MGLFSSLFGKKESSVSEQEKQEKKNFDILKYDGIRARNMHQFAYAIKCLEQATAIKEDVESMQYLAGCYIAMGKIEDAVKTYVRLSEIEPGDIKVLLALANVYFMLEDYEHMHETCNKAIGLDDKNQVAYFLAAKAFKGLKNDLQAIVMLSKAIGCDEKFIDAYLLRAEVLLNMRQANEALNDVEFILKEENDHEEALLLKGEAKAALGQLDECFESLDRVIELNPFNRKALLVKSNILIQQKKLDEALEVLDEGIELVADCADFYKTRGLVKMLKGDKKGSVEDAKKAMEINPDDANQISGNYNNAPKQNHVGIY